MSMANAAQFFFDLITELSPPLHLAVGPDQTEIIVRERNLELRQFMHLCKNRNDKAPRVTAVAKCFFHDVTWAINHPGGLTRLFELCLGAANNPRHLENVVLNVVFGGSEEGVPLRALAYALPWLETARRINNLGLCMPTIRILTAQMMAAHCLGKDKGLLWANTTTLFALIRSFTLRFYPEVAPQLVFDFDRPIKDEIKATLESLAAIFKQRAASDVVTREALEILEGMASSHGGDLEGGLTDSALLYGAGHPTTAGDFDYEGTAQTRFLEFIHNRSKIMIGLGTRAETKFWRVRLALTAQASKVLQKVKPRPWIMFFTRVGWDKPPYYLHPKGDLKWTESMDWHRVWSRLPTTVRDELGYLALCVGGVENLLAWITEISRHTPQNGPNGSPTRELFFHALLGSPIVTQLIRESGWDPNNMEEVSVWVDALSIEEQWKIVTQARNEWMGI